MFKKLIERIKKYFEIETVTETRFYLITTAREIHFIEIDSLKELAAIIHVKREEGKYFQLSDSKSESFINPNFITEIGSVTKTKQVYKNRK